MAMGSLTWILGDYTCSTKFLERSLLVPILGEEENIPIQVPHAYDWISPGILDDFGIRSKTI